MGFVRVFIFSAVLSVILGFPADKVITGGIQRAGNSQHYANQGNGQGVNNQDFTQFLPKTEPQYQLLDSRGSTQFEPVGNQEVVHTQSNNNQRPVQPANTQGTKSQVVYGYLQSVRKEWQCVNKECTEVTTNCENGKCDSMQSKFHAENYQPEVPIIDESKLESLDLDELFKVLGFPKVNFPSPNNVESTGTMDLVFDKKTFKYYFSNAKYINTKCKNSVCVTTTKTCQNGQCDETSSTHSL